MKRDSHGLNPSFNIAAFLLCLIDIRAMYNRIKTLTKEQKKTVPIKIKYFRFSRLFFI